MSLKKTFGNAFRGLWHFIRTESNNRIHLPAAILVVIAGACFRIDAHEWLLVVLAIGLVLLSEAFNAAIENLSDEIQPGYHERIKTIKDISAGAVLIAALVALAIGGIIFLPKVLEWL